MAAALCLQDQVEALTGGPLSLWLPSASNPGQKSSCLHDKLQIPKSQVPGSAVLLGSLKPSSSLFCLLPTQPFLLWVLPRAWRPGAVFS